MPTFGNLQPDGNNLYGSITTYSEAGFTVTNVDGFSSSFYNGYSNDTGQTPIIDAVDGTISITGSGLFSLSSFAAYTTYGNPKASYVLTGYVGGAGTSFATGSIAPGPATVKAGGSPLVTYSSFVSTLFDRVDIHIAGSGATYLDNIVLTPAAAAVPEPASWAMMVGGFGLLGAASRRRQRVNVRYA